MALIIQGMNAIDWNYDVAGDDLRVFFGSVFGRVVVAGYFLSGLSLVAFMIYEASARADNYLYWALPVLMIFGIGAALPFYLYLRMPK